MPNTVPLLSAPIRRVQSLELHEIRKFPSSLRNAITEVLRTLCLKMQVHEAAAPILRDLMKRAGTRRVIDLCSGAGGPIVPAWPLLGDGTTVMLTDRFPNLPAFSQARRNSGGAVEGWLESVDARRVPSELRGVRTLFNAFHHFSPEAARAILMDAYRCRQPIAIFEITERTWWRTLSIGPLSFLTMLALLPKMENRRPMWWVLTYLLPVLPLVFAWDGFVSCLRTYDAKEFRELTAGLSEDGYRWSMGRVRAPGGPMFLTYYLGEPVN